jgi:hypothetical protein
MNRWDRLRIDWINQEPDPPKALEATDFYVIGAATGWSDGRQGEGHINGRRVGMTAAFAANYMRHFSLDEVRGFYNATNAGDLTKVNRSREFYAELVRFALEAP